MLGIFSQKNSSLSVFIFGIIFSLFLNIVYNNMSERYSRINTVCKKEIDDMNKEFNNTTRYYKRKLIGGNKEKMKVMLFYTNWCGYSKQFMPIWDSLLKDFESNSNVELIAIDADNDKSGDQYGVQGYPTIVLVKNNQSVHYNGMRDVDSIKQWISEN